MDQVVVYKGRTEKHLVKFPYLIPEDDVVTSEIRSAINPTSSLIATWDVEILDDRRTAVITLDDTITADISAVSGYMDFKRVSGGEPIRMTPAIPVLFRKVVTA